MYRERKHLIFVVENMKKKNEMYIFFSIKLYNKNIRKQQQEKE